MLREFCLAGAFGQRDEMVTMEGVLIEHFDQKEEYIRYNEEKHLRSPKKSQKLV